VIDPKFNPLIELLGRALARQVLTEMEAARKTGQPPDEPVPRTTAAEHGPETA
jgi:hypothetical protein